MTGDRPQRRRIRVTGTVQGVGFRPFVYRAATGLGLRGFVRNDSEGVLIEVEGAPDDVSELQRLLDEDPPTLARVCSVEVETLIATGATEPFGIVESAGDRTPDVPVAVDTATCDACLAELDDPANRRYRYPFTNCTACGPRYTIVESVPYDRPATTMAGFTMCAACQQEYDDPRDRRFHAQPNACPRCGPQLRWCRNDGTPLAGGDDALIAAVTALRDGAIVAVKGIGGYHLATDATDDEAVAELRRRKARDDKPFAIMAPSLDAARRLCHLDEAAEGALVSPRRPIVLAPRRSDAGVAAAVAPGLPDLGLLLPYSPLHHLLLREVDRPLVMTSGNHSDEPIAHQDDDAFGRLGPLVDGFLTHDRPIHIRCDDSVARSRAPDMQLVRRSRGYAPEPLQMMWAAHREVVAVGAELKSTVAIAKGSAIVPSHHLGDLEHLPNYRAFVQAVDHLCRLYGVHPAAVAYDLHPEYLSTKFALDLDLPAVPVQHHHAHVASCLAEHGRAGPVLGLAFDGLGYGSDGTLWGGEFLVADLQGFTRVAHLREVPLPGGTAAIREPWRMALTWLSIASGTAAAKAYGAATDKRYEAVLSLGRREGGPRTTSMGRLFDAVAALLGGRHTVTYEAQAAIELEAMARTVPRHRAPAYPVDVDWSAPLPTLDPVPLVCAVAADHARGVPPPVVAAGFHESIARAAVEVGVTLARQRGLGTVALTGGVFQNVRLTDAVQEGLLAAGLEVLTHRGVPPNDGGISVGQAAIAAYGPDELPGAYTR